MKFLSLLLFSLPLLAQPAPPGQLATIADLQPQLNLETWKPVRIAEAQSHGRTVYRWSVATLVTANVVDAASSWNGLEGNPLLARPGTRFGASSVAIKSGFVGASLLLQHFALRHHPGLYKRMAWINFAASGALGGVAAHNFSIR